MGLGLPDPELAKRVTAQSPRFPAELAGYYPEVTTTAAAEIVRTLERAGVTALFALPGEENLPLVSALAGSTIELVVCRHEQHAGFMAVAHARLTGDLGVCLATLGPGALNTFTPLAQAELMRVPLLVITGQKALRDNDEGSFQIVDVTGAARQLCSFATQLADPARAQTVMIDSISRARRGAAVLVEIPEDVASARIEESAPEPVLSSRQPTGSLPPSMLDRIQSSERPLILAASGSNNPAVARALDQLGRSANLPVLATQMGKGAVDERAPYSLRSLGIHRIDAAHRAVHGCDLVIAVGYQPAEHPPLAWNQWNRPTLHIDDKPAQVEAGYTPEQQAVGDIAALLRGFEAIEPVHSWYSEIRGEIEADLADERETVSASPSPPLGPLDVVTCLENAVTEDTVVALDNGAYKVWFARHHRTARPRTLMLDNALATMGAGLATGMEAARLGHPSVAVVGDGGFLMNVQDLETAHRLDLNLTVIVLCDDRYGFIAWHQDEQERERRGVDLTNPDFVRLAESFGIRGQMANTRSELIRAIENSMERGGLDLVVCPLSYETNSMLDHDRLARWTNYSTPAV